MVFESLVTDLLNKYLGQYVVDLDPSQLKIGIWGGNAKLENLELKATALDDLDLPIQVVRGYLGKLHLSIPWKSLYTEPTVVLLEDVFVLAKPNQDVKYDSAKEEKHSLEKKQKQLEKLEEARKLEEKKKKGKEDSAEDSDSFAEKLATQVIKNLQITIKNIHVRYEDSSSNPAMPFCIGLTLQNLSAQTTDEYYVPRTIKETVSIIHKFVALQNFAIYWNVNESFTTLPREKWIDQQRKMVDVNSNVQHGANIRYVLNPISASAKVKINSKPGLNDTIPKIFLAFVLENFAIDFTKMQYHSLMEMLDAMSRMSRNIPFRKYRPLSPPRGHPVVWWRYCYNAILEEDVRRVSRMWNWESIKQYRLTCKQYQKKYMEHMLHSSKGVAAELQNMEMVMNLVSITIYRQLALNEVMTKKRQGEEKKGSSGWFGGMFSKKAPKAATGRERIEALMPEKQKQEEMEKLYKAIGYAKNEVIQPFPKDYVAVKAIVHLKEISLGLQDDYSQRSIVQIVKLTLKDLMADFQQRPSADAIKFTAKVDSLTLTGAPLGQVTPSVIRSIQKESGADTNMALVHAVFETHPLDKDDVDQSVEAAVQPIEIIYDSHTLEQLIQFFKAPEDVVLQDLQEKAFSTFEDLRVSSTAGLIHAMDQRNVMDVDILVNASYLVIPKHGMFSRQSELLIVDFGSLSIISDHSHARITDPKRVTEAEVRENCFDRFNIEVKAVQVLLSQTGDDWQEARELSSSELHLLHPIEFSAKLAKSLVPDDPQLSQLIVDGTLQRLVVRVTDEKVMQALKLFESIPIPGGDTPDVPENTKRQKRQRTKSNLATIEEIVPSGLAVPALQHTIDSDIADDALQSQSPLTSIEDSNEPQFESGIANQVKVELSLKVIEVLLSVALKSTDNATGPHVEFRVGNVCADVKLRRWDLLLDASIGCLTLDDKTAGTVALLTTPTDQNMLSVKYRKCFFNGFLVLGPDWIATSEAKRATIHYRDEFDATDQRLSIHFTTLKAVMHQQALLNIMKMVDSFNQRIVEHATEARRHLKAARRSASRLSLDTSETSRRKSSVLPEQYLPKAAFEELKANAGVVEETELLVSATMDGFVLSLTSASSDLAVAHVQGLSTKVQVKQTRTEVAASMRDLHLTYCNEDVQHRQIVSMERDQVFKLEVIQHNNSVAIGLLQPDLELRLKVGQIKVVVLQKFFCDVLEFVEDFQRAIVAMKEAGRAVADTAAVKVADYRETSPKVKFDITVHAPMIVIPVTASVSVAIVADLGCLKVSNQFKTASYPAVDDEHTADDVVMDTMLLSLSDLSIFKAQLADNCEVTTRRLIMHPVNMAVTITRNLTPWCHAIPDIQATGNIKTIQMAASQDDIQTIVDLLYGNLMDGKSTPEVPSDVSESFLTPPTSPHSQSAESSDEEQATAGDVDEDPLSASESKPWTTIAFTIHTADITTSLYRSPSDMTSNDQFADRLQSNCLTQFTIGCLDSSGAMLSNGAAKVNLELDKIGLDDLRGHCHSNAARMIQCQSSDDADAENTSTKMLVVKVERTDENDRFVDVKLRSMAFILNLEFIKTISSMVTDTLPESKQSQHPQSRSPSHVTELKTTKNSAAVIGNDSNWPTTRLHVVCHRPRVILLADASVADTKALFLESQISFTYFEKYGSQKMVALVSQTEITCAPLDSSGSHDLSSVISLSQLDVHGSSPPNGKPHLTVSSSTILVNLSPSTIHTLAMAFNSLPVKKEEEKSDASAKDLSNLWDINMSKESDAWYLAPVDEDKLVPGCMVWCRNRLGDYEYGFLSQKDTHCTVLFHPDGQITHSARESPAVILDRPDMQQHDFIIGDNVAVRQPDSDIYALGFVKQTWQCKDPASLLVALDDDLSNADEPPQTAVKDDATPKLLVEFTKRGNEMWTEQQDVIHVPWSSGQVMPGVGALVFARWKTGVYHRGRVRAHKDFKCIVYLTDLEESLGHDLDDLSSVVANACPPIARLKKGARVICGKLNSKWYYPGWLLSADHDSGTYQVHLDDGEVVEATLGRICLLPLPNTDSSPAVGCSVYCRVANGSPNYERGVLLEREKKQLIKFNESGQRLSIPLNDVDAVVWNIPPHHSSLVPNLIVIATREEKSALMTRGVIQEVNTMNAGRPLYRVEFWDGKKLWVSSSRIRIVQGVTTATVDQEVLSDARREQFILNIDGIKVRLEGYLGGQIMPLLQLDTKVHADVKDWSTKLVARADATVTATYYNETVAEWEYLIEPVSDAAAQRPWELAIVMETAAAEALPGDQVEDSAVQEEDSQMLLQSPLTTIRMESLDVLELTISKRSLLIMRTLGSLFTEAVMTAQPPVESRTRPPFVIANQLGLTIDVIPGQLLRSTNEDHSLPIRLVDGANTSLFSSAVDKGLKSPSRKGSPVKLRVPTIAFQVEGFHPIKDVSIKRQRLVIYDLIPLNLMSSNSSYSVVVQIAASEGQRLVVIRSPLQVVNHFPIPIDLLHVTDTKDTVKDVTIASNESYSVPLSIAYHCSLRMRPSGHGYKESDMQLAWNAFPNDKRMILFCKNATDSQETGLYIQVIREEQSYTSLRSGLVAVAPRYTLQCHPSVVMRNYLPLPVQYKTQGMDAFESLKGGDRWPLFAINCADHPVVEIKLRGYNGLDWSGKFTAKVHAADEPTCSLLLMADGDEQSKLEVGLYFSLVGSLTVTVYAPYWVVNKSGKALEYQASCESSVVRHEEGSGREPLLFLIKGNKKKMRLRVKDCEWSEAFPVDTIGSGGSLESAGKRGQVFEIGVDIQLSYFSLTKIVTLTPRHMLSNHTDVKISLAEANAPSTEWHDIPPGQTIPFWPAVVPPRDLFVHVSGRESVKFDPLPVTSLLLKLDNEFGGVCATYQLKDSVSLLSFSPYFAGAAPVRIENRCQHVGLMSYRQSSCERSYVVCYGQSVLYTWEQPTGDRSLTCSVVNADGDAATLITLDKNEFGRMRGEGSPAVYWVSFLDGLQRVLLFTEDFRVAYRASQEQTLRPTQELVIELEGLGLSLVNAEKKLEVAYIGIRKSDIVWEERGSNRWKTMNGKLCAALEAQFQKKQLKESSAAEEFSRLTIDEIEVDLNRMIITRPSKCRIRRTFHSGIALKYITSPNLMQFYAKVNTIQIDSQIPGSIFQTALHRVAPPKSIAAENAPKPLLEFSLTSRVGEKQHVNEIKYLKLLIQEMDVRVDKGFLLGVIDFFGSQQQRMSETEQFKYDIDIVRRTLEDSPEFRAAKHDSRFYFDYFHMSPLKVHVSFSMVGGQAMETSQLHTNVLNLLFQSVGVAFTEVQDVEFKLACFEVQAMLLSQQQLLDSVVKHYENQALKQLYVLVLGLDVLGNPFGLISGITVGAKNFFYEPYQGLIQGPEEFAEGLALGVKSLVGGTVGGAAGAVSRITGTFGKGLAALTLDDDYQQKRRREMSQRPTNVGQGLVKGGKGFVRGVVSGVTGIVTKPVEGAKKGGTGGFFKGVGKGLIGVVARPTGGLVDFASSTFEGLKSTAGGSTAVAKLRAPRVFHADKVLRPFHDYESFGYNVLMEVDKGRFSTTDFYMAHAQVDGGNTVIVTNGHVIYATKGDLLSEWSAKWFLAFREMRDDVDVKDTVMTLHLVVAKKTEGLFSKATTFRKVKFGNSETAEWFSRKITEAIML